MGREIREFVPRPKTFVSRTETGVVVRVKGKGEETPRPKSKTDRGIIYGEEADRRAERAARDARRKTMRELRPDGSRKRASITTERK